MNSFSKNNHFSNCSIQPQWSAPKNIRALVTTNFCGDPNHVDQWGHNLGTHVSEPLENVLRKRQALALQLKISSPLWLQQTHSNKIINIQEEGQAIYLQQQSLILETSAGFPQPNWPQADAWVCTVPNTPIGVLTADCLPIILTNKKGTEVAAIHAGWRGLENKIIAETLNTMQSNSSEIIAWLGPCISNANYEVGTEFIEQFSTHPKDMLNKAFIKRDDKIYFDLRAFANLQLHMLGVKNILDSEYCTYHDKRWFSHRQFTHQEKIQSVKNVCGRFATLIWLDGK
ncbi:MAG: peptidoglycan editing factor PgeF [Pseudomonadota bacterium]